MAEGSDHRSRGAAIPEGTTGECLTAVGLQVDMSVTFDQVGGMDHYIRALKEMIFLPLVYPELFERFHISPPRGVLFYGPPGAQACPVTLSMMSMMSVIATHSQSLRDYWSKLDSAHHLSCALRTCARTSSGSHPHTYQVFPSS